MGAFALFVLFATPLRTGCDSTDEVAGYLEAGAPVTIRYAINGCIAVSSGELRGFLASSAIANLEEFERARREAPAAGLIERSNATAIKDDANARNEAAGDRLISSRFDFRYDGAMPVEQARPILDRLEEEFTRISAEIGCRFPEERINVIILNREDYLRTTGAAEWSAGVYDGRIRVSLQQSAQTRATLSHELVHACLASTGDWPAWFHEGLAQKLSGQTVSEERRKRVRAAGLPKLAQMNQTFAGMSAENASVAYAAAAMAVELFYTHYREMGVANLVRSPERLAAIAEDLDRRLRQ